MKRLIEFLIEGCFHKWEVYKQNPYEYVWTGTGSSAGQSHEFKGTMYVLRCSRCGKMKTFRDGDDLRGG